MAANLHIADATQAAQCTLPLQQIAVNVPYAFEKY